jgi:AbrB family looped-hinge helix DNA binding protein
MKKRKTVKSTCAPRGKENSCCRVESVVTVDERGQMVLPKEIREAAKIRAGDKLAIILLKKDDEVCCLTMMKVDELSDAVRSKLGPVFKVVM